MLYRSAKKLKIIRGAVIFFTALTLLLAALPTARAVELPPIEITARNALLIDKGSGEILYERNINEKAYPASLTKIMTAMLALEYARTQPEGLGQQVTASPQTLDGLEEGGSTQGIKPGEILTVRDLLNCTLVASANEACNVLAEYVAGSIPAFVELMNERARALGCQNTHFTNPHGLHDDNHYTTAFDMYLITKAALEDAEFMEFCNTAATSVEPTNLSPARALHTTNHLISALIYSQYIYHQAKGIKTGNTSLAGHCLVSTAEQDGLFLISVVMGCEKEAETGLVLSFVETKRLFEWGFENYTTKTLLSMTEQIAQVKVHEGKDKDEVTLVPDLSELPNRKLEALVPKTLDAADVQRDVKLFDEGGVIAPVERGQKLGEITLSYGDRIFGTIPLVASSEVLRNETEHIVSGVKDFFNQDWVKYSLGGLAAVVVLYLAFVIVYNRRRRRGSGRSNYRGRRRRRRR